MTNCVFNNTQKLARSMNSYLIAWNMRIAFWPLTKIMNLWELLTRAKVNEEAAVFRNAERTFVYISTFFHGVAMFSASFNVFVGVFFFFFFSVISSRFEVSMDPWPKCLLGEKRLRNIFIVPRVPTRRDAQPRSSTFHSAVLFCKVLYARPSFTHQLSSLRFFSPA